MPRIKGITIKKIPGNNNIVQRQKLLMLSVDLFFKKIKDSDKDKLSDIRDIISVSKNSKVSLRVIDYFVSKFSKKNNTCINNIPIYPHYKTALSSFSKLNFDPFRRDNRFDYKIGDFTVSTTVGQLVFFRWAIKLNIIPYIIANISSIEEELSKH